MQTALTVAAGQRQIEPAGNRPQRADSRPKVGREELRDNSSDDDALSTDCSQHTVSDSHMRWLRTVKVGGK